MSDRGDGRLERFRRRLPPPRDPWASAPTGELTEQLLPRWFVILALVSIPLAIAAFVAAFVAFSPADTPVAARRPPPAEGSATTTAVGEVVVGESAPVVYDDACPMLEGVRVAGSAGDRDALRRGLAALCNTVADPGLEARMADFAAAGGVVRFAVFEETGVDSTGVPGRRTGDPPTILLNNRYAATDPRWIAPLLAHDLVALGADGAPGTAAAELAATRAEAAVCESLPAADRSPACGEAAALLALDDPLAALREVGYR